LIAKICLYVSDAEIIMCDFKGDDSLSYLSNAKGFYRYTECFDGLDMFYNRFVERQNGNDASRTPLILYFDELAAAVNHCEKKSADLLKKKIANLLMLGRSFSCFLILAMQRPDAEYLSGRDNIQLVVSLNNLSPQGKQMFFSEVKHLMVDDRKRGTGYMLESGANLYKVIVPSVQNMDKLHQTILAKLNAQCF